MTWWEAVLWTLATPVAFAAYALAGDVLDRSFQSRMDATLWEHLKRVEK